MFFYLSLLPKLTFFLSFVDYSTEELILCNTYYTQLSLYVNQETALCARLSLGGAIEMCRAVADERISNGFAIIRSIHV
jgi:histone deacetylase 6